MSGRHHIHRQALVLELGGPASGKGWHHRLEELQRERLLPAMEGVFDRFEDGSNRCIERLEVTVTVADAERMEANFGGQFARALSRALADLGADQASAAQVPASAAFLHFLRTGNMHWSVGRPAEWLMKLPASFREWTPTDWLAFVKLARSSATARERLRALPENVLTAIFDLAPTSDVRDGAEIPHTGESTGIENLLAPLRYGERGMTPEVKAQKRGSPPTSSRVTATPGSNETTELSPAWYPENAGIVLLHPYLKYLLERVGCRPSPERPNELGRAATLLHYLAFGTTDCREWELPLTKLLLGLHPDELLRPADRLADRDRIEADDVLSGVIDHWSVLGSTSPAALREGFLQRPGKLERAPTGWRLTVEERPHDLLLDRLPWSITPVRSPWMDELLQVDWR
jgi:hypothetical protein